MVLIVSFAAGFGGVRIDIQSGDVGSAGALGASLFGSSLRSRMIWSSTSPVTAWGLW
ncbi:MAG: hypothetical protein WKF73_20350 [Nocardioidaceae bacterium]